MHPSSDPENFYLWKCLNDFRRIYCQPLCLSGATKNRKNKNPWSKGFYIHSAEMNQRCFIFIGKDWPIVPFFPVALHVHRVFPIVSLFLQKSCKIVQWFNLTKVVLCCWEVNVLDTRLDVLFLLTFQGSSDAEPCVYLDVKSHMCIPNTGFDLAV